MAIEEQIPIKPIVINCNILFTQSKRSYRLDHIRVFLTKLVSKQGLYNSIASLRVLVQEFN